MAVAASNSDQNNPPSPPPEKQKKKRTTNPGVRVVGGLMYDSQNGKTCHQCRQKTLAFVAVCKGQWKKKPCARAFCQRCLWNRYEEKAEDVQVLEDWSCPRCRHMCNCSVCRKKSGKKPTGILVHKARESGFSSVSGYLASDGPENFNSINNAKDKLNSPNKLGASETETVISSPRKRGKENSFVGKININSVDGADLPKESSSNMEKIISKKSKRKGSNKVHDSSISDMTFLEGNSKKPRIFKENKSKELETNENVHDVFEKESGSETRASVKIPCNPSIKNEKNTARDNKSQNGFKNLDAEILLPNGAELTVVADIDLPPKDVGNALQFLEFCASFGKILNLKKGQSTAILKEIINGRGRLLRREQYSAAVELHRTLLSLIHKNSNSRPETVSASWSKNNWWNALKSYISESQDKLNSPTLDCLDTEAGEYDTLDSSTKLSLLNYLCDEVLETEKIRNWIDDQNLKYAKMAKEAQEKVLKAKAKEKRLKQKMMDDVAKAIVAKNGAPLSISEHDEIVGQIKSNADEAHEDMLQSMGMVPKKKQRADAVRTASMLLDIDGHAYWKLNSYSNKCNILVQDIGIGDDSVVLGEKWLAFDVEQEKLIEKRIKSRERRLRAQTVTETFPSGSTEPNI